MEYFIGALSIITLVLNFLTYRRVTATYAVGTVEELELASVHCCYCKSDVEQPDSEASVEAHDPPPAKNQGVYSAWTNQKEIPWVAPTAPPEPIIKPVNRGPLARPDGFV